ncbi:MAG: hypothetical protein JNM63_20000 [Spirochaetia bacterium]|nr:hypothetical protein [Spirochaetia bacterium]
MRRHSTLKFLFIFVYLICSLFGESPVDEASNDLTSKLSNFEPSTNYEDISIQGWPIRVSKRLILQTNLYAMVIKELDRELEMTARRLPTPAVSRLRKVRIWLELDNLKSPGGVYHPSAVWLSNHGFNPEKARCIEFGVARNFVEWPRWQPYMVMHELAHAWHHQVLGYDYPPLKEAYRLAVESKSYEQVLHIQGQKKRHYGLNNVQEYFAECTEAFFGVNDFYPFVRPEFKEHDPVGARAVEEAWNQPVK